MAETQTLNKTIPEHIEDTPKDVFFPSEKEQEVVQTIWNLWDEARQQRDQNLEYFDGRDLIEFIDDNVKRFVTNEDEREEIEDWQARIFDPFTRNKVIAILSKASAVLPKSEVLPVGDEDGRRALLTTDLLEYANRTDDEDELMFFAMLEALVKGTVVGFEGYEEKNKKIREVTNYDGSDKISIKEGTEKSAKLTGFIVPLEDFYPGSVGIRKIKDMPFCFWRTIMPTTEFKMKFANYEKATEVPEHMPTQDERRPFYADYISSDVNVDEGRVEVIRYFNQDTDEYIIIANGIWLNPMTASDDEGDKEEIMPLPFTHKSLPFWSAIYEPFGSDFFYGKPLTDKLKAMQDYINTLHNMMLDQSFLSIFPPLLIEGADDIEDDFLRPGRRIEVSNPDKAKELQISPPGNFHSFILQFTKQVLEETSVDAVNQGVSGTGDRVTATEVERAAQAVSQVIGMFGNFIKWGKRDKDKLRVQNIFQFYGGNKIEQILGSGGSREFSKAFKTFKIDDTVLTSGKRGTKLIEVFRNREDMPNREQQQIDAAIAKRETNRNIEKIAITPQYIRKFDFDLRLTPMQSPEHSQALEKALTLEKARVYMEFFPDMVDKEELMVQIAEVYGDRPEKIISKNVLNPQPQQGQGQFPNAGNMGVGQNMINGATGNNPQGARSVRDLISTQ